MNYTIRFQVRKQIVEQDEGRISVLSEVCSSGPLAEKWSQLHPLKIMFRFQVRTQIVEHYEGRTSVSE